LKVSNIIWVIFSRFCFWVWSVDLLADRATFRQSSFASRGLTQDGGARRAEHNRVGVRKHSGDLEAPRALDIHEVAVWSLNKSLELVEFGFVGLWGV